MRCQRNAAAPATAPVSSATAARTRLALVALAALPALGCTHRSRAPGPVTAAEEVHDYLGTPSRAAGDQSPLASEPRTLWSFHAGKGPLGAPAVGDRVIAVATVDRWLYVLDATTGAPRWRYHGDAPFAAGPLLGDGQLYAAEEGARGNVLAVSLADGKRRWRVPRGDVTGPIALAGGTLFGVTQQRGVAFALDASTGHARWRRLVGPSRSGVLVTGGRVALTTLTDSLIVLEAASGRVLHAAALPSPVAAPLARIDDSTVAAASPSGAVMALSLATGRVLWRVATGDPVHGAPAVVGDTVYAMTNGCTLWAMPAVSPSGGPPPFDTVTVTPPPTTVAATAKAPPPIVGPSRCTTVAGPTIVRDGVLVATVSGEILYFNRAARRPVWARQLRGELRHPPIVRNGQIVVAPLLGDVVSLR